ncbi:MAG: cytochrome c oxidase subunit II [Bacteroidia bacterium]
MSKLLILLVILLSVVAIAQIIRVYELTAKLSNRKEEEVSNRDNKLNAWLMLLFMLAYYAFFGWLVYKYGDGGLGESASEHGKDIDWLMDLNMWIITIVFLLTTTLLFSFAFIYHYRKERKALWFPHSNKLELIWTVVPAMVLAVIIVLGLKTWNSITKLPEKGTAERVEIYAKQFDWTIRYSGTDNELGLADFKVISGTNPLGIITQSLTKQKVEEIDAEIKTISELLKAEGKYIPNDKRIEMEEKVERLARQKKRIIPIAESLSDSTDAMSFDDMIVRGELHLVKGKTYLLDLKSQDVIHSAYLPHFRTQMNCVPGMTTSVKIKPILTTEEMREQKNNPNFDYILLCNKICGAAHSNMKLKVIVETQEEFDAWIAKKMTIAENSAGGDK